MLDTFVPPEMRSEEDVLRFLDSVERLKLPPVAEVKREWVAEPTVVRCNQRIARDQYQELKSKNGNCKISLALALALDSSSLADCWNQLLPTPDSIWATILLIDPKLRRVAVELDQYPDWNSTIVFLENNRVLECHYVHHRYGLQLQFFQHSTGHQLLHYRHCEGASSGTAAEFQEHYFLWGSSGLRPVLTIPNSISARYGWRDFFIDSKPIHANPLQIQFNYQQKLWDPGPDDPRCRWDIVIIEDSAIVTFHFDSLKSKYIGDWVNSKLSYRQFLTYKFDDEEILFIKAHYRMLKKIMRGNDMPKRRAVRYYLSEVMKFEHDYNLD